MQCGGSKNINNHAITYHLGLEQVSQCYDKIICPSCIHTFVLSFLLPYSFSNLRSSCPVKVRVLQLPNVQGRWESIVLFLSTSTSSLGRHIHFEHGPVSRIRLAAYGCELQIAVYEIAASKQQRAAGDKYGCAD